MKSASKISSEWWDYTTIDRNILEEAAKLTIKDIQQLERPGFKIKIYDTLETFF